MDVSEGFAQTIYRDLYTQWENTSDREKRSRMLFAQRMIGVGRVAQEWQAMQAAIGAGVDVERFVTQAIRCWRALPCPCPMASPI